MTIGTPVRANLPGRLARMRFSDGADNYVRLCREIAEAWT